MTCSPVWTSQISNASTHAPGIGSTSFANSDVPFSSALIPSLMERLNACTRALTFSSSTLSNGPGALTTPPWYIAVSAAFDDGRLCPLGLRTTRLNPRVSPLSCFSTAATSAWIRKLYSLRGRQPYDLNHRHRGSRRSRLQLQSVSQLWRSTHRP